MQRSRSTLDLRGVHVPVDLHVTAWREGRGPGIMAGRGRKKSVLRPLSSSRCQRRCSKMAVRRDAPCLKCARCSPGTSGEKHNGVRTFRFCLLPRDISRRVRQKHPSSFERHCFRACYFRSRLQLIVSFAIILQ